jgi:hypothetical protein
LGAILQWSVGKHPQGIRLGNSHDHGACFFELPRVALSFYFMFKFM